MICHDCEHFADARYRVNGRVLKLCFQCVDVRREDGERIEHEDSARARFEDAIADEELSDR